MYLNPSYLSCFTRPPNFLIRFTPGDVEVLSNRAIENQWILRNDGDISPELPPRNFTDVTMIDYDGRISLAYHYQQGARTSDCALDVESAQEGKKDGTIIHIISRHMDCKLLQSTPASSQNLCGHKFPFFAHSQRRTRQISRLDHRPACIEPQRC